jgi:hypothetical protein
MTELEKAIIEVVQNEIDFDQVTIFDQFAVKIFCITNEEAAKFREAIVYEVEEKCVESPIVQKIFDLIKIDPVRYAKPWIDRYNLAIDRTITEFMGIRSRQDEIIARQRATVAHLEALIQ